MAWLWITRGQSGQGIPLALPAPHPFPPRRPRHSSTTASSLVPCRCVLSSSPASSRVPSREHPPTHPPPPRTLASCSDTLTNTRRTSRTYSLLITHPSILILLAILPPSILTPVPPPSISSSASACISSRSHRHPSTSLHLNKASAPPTLLTLELGNPLSPRGLAPPPSTRSILPSHPPYRLPFLLLRPCHLCIVVVRVEYARPTHILSAGQTEA